MGEQLDQGHGGIRIEALARDPAETQAVLQIAEHAARRTTILTQGGDSVNHGEIAVQAERDYEASPEAMARGKIVLGRLKALLQKELTANSALVAPSPHLDEPRLRQIAVRIWPKSEGADAGQPESFQPSVGE